jgi:hypothetical protein
MIETNDDKKKVKNKYPDRFTIDPVNLEKIGSLLEQLKNKVQGCDANRKELLNWMIEKFPTELSAADLLELTTRFYDEEKFLRSALDEIKEAKSRGVRLTLDEIMQRNQTMIGPTVKRGRKKKSDLPTEDEEAPNAVKDQGKDSITT